MNYSVMFILCHAYHFKIRERIKKFNYLNINKIYNNSKIIINVVFTTIKNLASEMRNKSTDEDIKNYF